MRSLVAIAAGAAMLTLPGGIAAAADLSAPPPDPGADSQLVELGTGWYLRGDAAWTRDSGLVLDAAGRLKASGIKNGFLADLGAGYQFNKWFRIDGTFELRNFTRNNGVVPGQLCTVGVVPFTSPVPVPNYRPNFINAGCNANFRSRVSRTAVLVNGYIDLGTWSSITPYVGAGIGTARIQNIGSTVYTFLNGDHVDQKFTDTFTGVGYRSFYDTTYKKTAYNLAWALMGGVAVDVSPHVKLDVGYRYASFGNYRAYDVAAKQFVSKKVDSQEVHGGIRYMID